MKNPTFSGFGHSVKFQNPKIYKSKVLRMWESRGSAVYGGLEIDDGFGHPLYHDPMIHEYIFVGFLLSYFCYICVFGFTQHHQQLHWSIMTWFLVIIKCSLIFTTEDQILEQ